MDNASSVLVTGTAGRVGQAACQALLARGHQVRAFDIRKSPGVDDARIGDISDLSQISNAMSQIDVVVHLAATPDEADFMNKLLPNNIVGTYNVLESARQARVGRVIIASTGQVVMGHDGPWPITPEMPFSPRNWYASAKVMAEVAGQFYAHVHGLSVIVARLGWCPRDKQHADELAGDEFGKDVYLSPRDAGRFFLSVQSKLQSSLSTAWFSRLVSPYTRCNTISRQRSTSWDLSRGIRGRRERKS